ncbi:hypothetical protein CDL60_18995 [Roseateles noduli]|nr:hypothetical protein CDL60_18995 [Roseateles noduli]
MLKPVLLTLISLLPGIALAAQDALPDCQAGEPVSIATPAGRLQGTREAPAESRHPVAQVLIIAGSGPTDRDGNSPGGMRNNSLCYLAKALAAEGMSVLRYDKRGVAGSRSAAVKEIDLRFQTFVDDAGRWIDDLREREPTVPLVVIGHSEGALVGALATQAHRADGFISLAGSAHRLGDLLRLQFAARGTAAQRNENERILTALEAGHPVDDVPPELAALYRSSVQPYLLSSLPLDPTKIYSRLDLPVLVAHGTTDIQVPVEDADTLARSVPKASRCIVEGMNHILKQVPAETLTQLASYADPSLPVSPSLTRCISAFIRTVPAPRAGR